MVSRGKPIQVSSGIGSGGFMFGLVFGGLAIVGAGVFYLSVIREPQRKMEALWAGAQVAKICRDGTHIFNLTDGSYRTGGLFSQRVSGPEVCE